MDSPDIQAAIKQTNLNQKILQTFMQQFPAEAARELECLAPSQAARLLALQAADAASAVWSHLMPKFAGNLISFFDDELLKTLLVASDSGRCANLLSLLSSKEREHCLKVLPGDLAEELNELLNYPQGSAGQLMDTRVPAFHSTVSVGQVAAKLKHFPVNLVQKIYVLNDKQQLTGYVDLARLIQSENEQSLGSLSRPVSISVTALDPKSIAIGYLQENRLDSLPVLDAHGHLAGVIHADRLLDSIKEDLTSDMQSMVGASKEEKALSSSWFAVRKRQGWLQINLLTGCLAASVVGMFESTIAQFTALAVLMPIAAGQSGNTGAQALAVTMRGLTLREITTRQWYRVMLKETGAGFINGVAVACTCGLGVYIWSQSLGLALVISMAMVISMTIAGISGALVPLVLKKVGLDPAQSSSIILTTVTDIAGFMSFLGIASALSFMLISQ